MTTGLATDVAGIRESMSGFSTPAGRVRGLALRPRASDVFISTYPKCGTTLMQQVVHGLRTGGDMDFGEITEVVPWLELAHDVGVDPDAEQRATPRAFKTHLDWEQVPKGGRHIYLVRDPRDVLVSFHHFFSGWIFEPGAVSLDAFAREHFMRGTVSGRYWEHLASWWPQRDADDVLVLAFEDVVADLPGTVERVARFIGVPPEPERLEVATRQSHIDFMRAHGPHFDDHFVREARREACGLPPGGHTTKVREGRVGGHREVLDDALIDALDAVWRETVEPATGHPTYASLRAALAR